MTTEEIPVPATIVTLRIDLVDTDPPIWREIDVPTSMTLKQVHAVVQAAMDWENAHLWQFSIGRERIAESRAAKLCLYDILRPRSTKLFYLYDFGDSWEHQLTLTHVRPADPRTAYPRYVAGERAAPPEDCGGIPGFYARLEILEDPKHPDYEEVKGWLGNYDPKTFDEQRIRDRLKRIGSRQSGVAKKPPKR